MKASRIAQYALLIALALILSYVESLIPLSFAVPGIKLGLPNIVIVFALYRLGAKDAWIISILRVLMVSAMFGNAFSLAYSLSGAVISLAVMMLLMKTKKFSCIGVSIAGGVCHNLGQILCAMVVLGTKQIIYYLPVLLIFGTAAGIVIGIVAGVLTNRIDPRMIKK